MGKMSVDEGNSRRSCDQEGAGLDITKFPPEPISLGTCLQHLASLMKRELIEDSLLRQRHPFRLAFI